MLRLDNGMFSAIIWELKNPLTNKSIHSSNTGHLDSIVRFGTVKMDKFHL